MQQPSTIFKHLLTDRSWFAIALVALVMPFYFNWSVITIIILLLALISDLMSWKRLTNFTRTRMLFPMILLYVMYGIGILYSTDRAEGLGNLQTKLPLLLFPVFLSTIDYSKRENTAFVMLSFMTGCLLAGLICFCNAIYIWLTTGENHFFYIEFSIFMHPSYFALYLNFILCYIYQKLIFEDGVKYVKTPAAVFILFFINGLILMLSSKAGIFTAGLVQLIMLIASSIRRKKSRKVISIFLGVALFYFLFYKVILPDGYERIAYSERIVMGKPILNTASESSSLRLLIWKSSLPLVKKSFLYGTGTGDVKNELLNAYKTNGITAAFEKELNAHNQFLQTVLAIGLPGLILLLFSLVLPFFEGIRKKKYLLYMFPLIMAFNLLFESMLERQAGVVFFAFFATLLIMNNSKRLLIQSK